MFLAVCGSIFLLETTEGFLEGSFPQGKTAAGQGINLSSVSICQSPVVSAGRNALIVLLMVQTGPLGSLDGLVIEGVVSFVFCRF